ncbi:MAG: hypothetical protein QM533_10805 [Cytophagales bacterium]|nr:hypothetical protein [Cytophagales bacterium]
MRPRQPYRRQPAQQRGLVAILLLVSLAMLTVTIMTKDLWGGDPRAYQTKVTQEALRQAKEALLTYVAVGRDTTLIQAQILTAINGRLPCPNAAGDSSTPSSCGSGTATGEGYHAFGLFPWATLNTPVIRDAAHQCLWYAVDGYFKAGSSSSNFVNADSFGSFSVIQPVKYVASDGTITWQDKLLAGNESTTTPNSPDRVVAVIIAPGPAGGAQTQSATGTNRVCALTGVDAQASAPSYFKNYLDVNISGNSRANNQTIITNFTSVNLSKNTQSATANNSYKTFITADVGREQLNDQVIWITAEEFAKAATKRTANLYASAIHAFVSANGFYPGAASTLGGSCDPTLLQGYMPYTCSGLVGANDLDLGTRFVPTDLDGWAAHSHYAVSEDCIGSKTGVRGTPAVVDSVQLVTLKKAVPCRDAARVNLGTGTNGPAAIILMRGRMRTTQTSCQAYQTKGTASAPNIAGCLEDSSNKATVHAAYTTPLKTPADHLASVNYRVPQPASSNDVLIQLSP